ncbi:MAG: 2-oxo acid dehydrogenase subunit E2 [Oscillospiraceae bacterium]|nr:2-oxo acid dehydrogenase subunit E2 [Oscillospiraceae bacterium]
MFGFRSDGRRTKGLSPFSKLMPHIMKTRTDSQVYYTEDIPIANMDKYISKKAEEGIKISYMHIVYAAIIKLLHTRPSLNRFIMNGVTYDRDGIHVSLVIKKDLTDESEESAIKLRFNGDEDIFEIKERLDKTVSHNKDKDGSNDTDALAKVLTIVPNFLIKFLMWLIKFLDKHGILPKAVINASPFHTSTFLTNVGSLGIDSIYHHIYDFGTTSIFIAMGKKKKTYIYEEDTIKEEKAISFSFVCDERICGGYYFANSIKQFRRFLKKPELLEKLIDEGAQHVE